jgi:hypothetical protein
MARMAALRAHHRHQAGTGRGIAFARATSRTSARASSMMSSSRALEGRRERRSAYKVPGCVVLAGVGHEAGTIPCWRTRPGIFPVDSGVAQQRPANDVSQALDRAIGQGTGPGHTTATWNPEAHRSRRPVFLFGWCRPSVAKDAYAISADACRTRQISWRSMTDPYRRASRCDAARYHFARDLTGAKLNGGSGCPDPPFRIPSTSHLPYCEHKDVARSLSADVGA